MASPCSVCFFLLLGSRLSVMAWCYHSIWKCWKCVAVPLCHFNSISLSFCLFICLWPLWDWLFYTRQTTYRQTTYRQTDRQTGWQTERLTERLTAVSQTQTDRKADNLQTDTDRLTNRQSERDKKMCKHHVILVVVTLHICTVQFLMLEYLHWIDCGPEEAHISSSNGVLPEV